MLNIPINLNCKLDDNFTIKLVSHEYRQNKTTPQECIDRNQTYAVELWGVFEIVNESGNTFTSSPKMLAKIPAPVNGEFIWASTSGLKANRYVLVKQLAKAPGFYYSQVETDLMTINYCHIWPVVGKGILLTKTVTGKSTKSYPRLTNDMHFRYENLEAVWKAFDGNFAVGSAGKLQMQWASNKRINSLDLCNEKLSFEELREIKRLFDGDLLTITDDRSLATRRVLRYENDHLPRLLQRALRAFEKSLKDTWPIVKHSNSDINREDPALFSMVLNQLISRTPLQQVFDSYFADNDLFQLIDATNPLSELSQKRRLTLKGPGGYPDKSMLLDKRDVHWTDFGRICPVETPQGQDLGFSLYMAKNASVDEHGFLCARYITNTDIKEEVEFNVHDEIAAEIVAGDNRVSANGTMQARKYDGTELSDAKPETVTHLMPSPDSHIGYAASLIPFFQHNDANRALMGANMMKQALPLLNNEPPFIQTGYEGKIVKDAHTENRCSKNGQLSLGANLLVGYIPWDFYTYEDSVAISDSLVRCDKLTHVETEEVYFDAVVAKLRGKRLNLKQAVNQATSDKKVEETKDINQNIYEVITSDSEYLEKIFAEDPQSLKNLCQFSDFTSEDFIDFGAFFAALEKDTNQSTREVSELIWGKIDRTLKRVISDQKLPENGPKGRKDTLANALNNLLHDTDFFISLSQSSFLIRKGYDQLVSRIPLANEIVRFSRAILEDIYPDYLAKNSDIIFDGIIREGSEFGPGDLLVSRLRLVSDANSDQTEKFAAAFLKNYLQDKVLHIGVAEAMEDASLYAAPGISGRILKTEWVDGLKDRRRLKIVFETKHRAKVGDKLTGRHGNKGVISRIIPEHEMPYFYLTSKKTKCCENGNCTITKPHAHLEMLINPLTITSRMNLGQLYETSSSWISVARGGAPVIASPFCTDLPWNAIVSELDNHGIPLKHKLFHLEEGKELAIGTDKTALGATVGYQYILKLKHLAEKKLKARNQSALSPSTGQPITPTLTNKGDIAAKWEHRTARKHSAQRLGEMEVWALQGHEAWHLLDELLFLKSDSVQLKLQMIESLRDSDRSRRKAFKEYERIAIDIYKWGVSNQGDKLVVTCGNEEEGDFLKKDADKYGIKVTKDSGNTYTLTYEPFEVVHRDHQALKSFVLYCRGLGFEVEGVVGLNNKTIELVNRDEKYLPRLDAVNIRVATDKDRKAWGARKITSYRGDNDHGLWPDEWDNLIKRDSSTEKKFNEQCDYIELPVPVDNPLFRGAMCLLLSLKGCLVDKKFMMSFQQLLTKRVIKFKSYSQSEWNTFWKEELPRRSRLLMREDVINWLKELTSQDTPDAPDAPDEEKLGKWLTYQTGIDFSFYFRHALPDKLTAKNRYALFPNTTENISRIDDVDKVKDLIKAAKSSRLHIRDLYRHFELMDFKVLRKRLDGLKEYYQTLGITQHQKNMLDRFIKIKFEPTNFFIKNLTVLPRNMRHERTSPRKKSSRSSVSHFAYENDLNYLYQNILITVDNIKQMKKLVQKEDIDLITPDIEERRLRPLVHALLSNRREKMTPVKRSSDRPLRGIIDILAGATASKEGFFSRHLLGKSTDYSGRAVIIPDPELGIDEASIPFSMGLKIFRDILVSMCMKNRDIVPESEPILRDDGSLSEDSRPIPEGARISIAKEYINNNSNQDTIRGWLVEAAKTHLILLNRAPSLHRLSILSFNTKFHDSDDCIHLNTLVCKPFNADFDGDTMAVHVPFLSSSIEEAGRMLPSNILRSPADGKLRIDFKKDHALASFVFDAESADDVYKRYESSCGRPDGLNDYITRNELAKSRQRLKQCGASLGIEDLIIEPTVVAREVENARNNVLKEVANARKHDPDLSEKKAITDYWQDTAKRMSVYLEGSLKPDSPVKLLRDSGAAKVDLQQLSGIRGIMMKPVDPDNPEMADDNLVEWPILSSIVSGMTPLEYFVSCHGSRNGLADKGLLTAPAGDITNTMVQAAQGISIVMEDCGTQEGLTFSCGNPLRLIGRFTATKIKQGNDTVLEAGEEITPEIAVILPAAVQIILRSPVTCESGHKGICQKCYGRELVRNGLASIGYPAGIIAAQSIGETGTQLTLSSFHTGGAAGTKEFGIMDVRKMFMKLDGRVEFAADNIGIKAAAIIQLQLFQDIYGKYEIADQHFETIIRTMFTDNMVRPVVEAAKAGDGFLSRLAFKDVELQLVKAVLQKERDDLRDIKSRVMVGQIL